MAGEKCGLVLTLLLSAGCSACPGAPAGGKTRPVSSARPKQSTERNILKTRKKTEKPAPAASVKRARPADIWPMFRGGPARRGRIATDLWELAPVVRWSHATGQPLFASPAVGADLVVVASRDGAVHALSSGGEARWRTPLGRALHSSPALTHDGVLVGSDAGALHLLDRTTGHERWRVSLGRCSDLRGFGADRYTCHGDASALVGPDGTIYIASDALWAVSPAGEVVWRVDLGEHTYSSPALAPDGTVVIGRRGGGVMAVDSAGNERWTFSSRADCDATPAVGEEVVVIGCDDRRVRALSLSDGAVRWTVRTRGAVRASAALSEAGNALVGADDGRLYAIGADGKKRWTYKTGGKIRSSALVDPQERAVFGSQDGMLHAVDGQGKKLWSVQLPADIDASPAPGPNNTLVVGCDDGKVYVLGPAPGN